MEELMVGSLIDEAQLGGVHWVLLVACAELGRVPHAKRVVVHHLSPVLISNTSIHNQTPYNLDIPNAPASLPSSLNLQLPSRAPSYSVLPPLFSPFCSIPFPFHSAPHGWPFCAGVEVS